MILLNTHLIENDKRKYWMSNVFYYEFYKDIVVRVQTITFHVDELSLLLTKLGGH